MQTFFRSVSPSDFDTVFRILREAAQTMVAKGRQQWDENYPAKTDLQADFDSGVGYVIEEDAEIVAYAAISFRGEPAYDALEGSCSLRRLMLLFIAWLFCIPHWDAVSRGASFPKQNAFAENAGCRASA